MQGYDEDGYSDNEEKDFTNEEWDMIDSLIDMFNITEGEAIKFLEAQDFDFDKTVNKIKKNLQKEKEKEEKKLEREIKKK